MKISDNNDFIAEMKEIRNNLLLRLEQSSSVSAQAEFQTLLANEIVRVETRIKSVKREFVFKEHLPPLKEHLLRLRLLGDSLAWKLLHPHAIRNLAKNDSRPPTLVDRLHELDKGIQTIQWLSTKNIPAIIADLTHCLRIGDLIIVQHPEMPDIIEFKTTIRNDQYRNKGRLGRQFHRMQKTAEYLTHGTAKFHNEKFTRMAIESNIHPEYDFALVESIASTAIHDGASFQMIRPKQWIGACRIDSKPVFPAKLLELTDSRVCLGFVSDALPEFINEVTPPFNWPINFDVRRAIMEGEVSIFHLIDPSLIQDQKIRVLPDLTFEVTVDKVRFNLSDYFLRQIVYGFQTPASIAKSMIDFAEKILKIGMHPWD